MTPSALVLLVLVLPVLACATLPPTRGGAVVQMAAAPSERERYCAWFGDARDGVLYFGQAAFYSTMRAHEGEPTADLLLEGPKPIGRFDLRTGKFLDSLAVADGGWSGVWDVLAHANGRVYFTSYFEPGGYVELRSGETRLFEALGLGLNELVVGPEGSLLASRYGSDDPRGGSVVRFDEEGRPIAEYRLSGPSGYYAAPKTLAYDSVRDQIWVNTDLLPGDDDGPIRHDTRVLDGAGKELHRFEVPAVHFVTFGPDGTGYLAEVDGSALSLRIVPPDAAASSLTSGRSVLLDDSFPRALEFAQDIQVAPDGRVVVTRWSGAIHVVDPANGVETFQLKRPQPGGLYYTGVLDEGRLCATYCGDVTVVCRPVPSR